jgi:uncharacterized protein
VNGAASPSDRPFDHSPAGHTRLGRPRLIALDVARAVALFGVIVMNYHGYLNDHGTTDAFGEPVDRSFAERLFHPFHGILTTRFAATFVIVAGMGIVLLTARSITARDTGAPDAAGLVADDRWRLARRGLLLFTVGYALDWAWPGTIIFFYGAYFMIAALLITLRSRTIAAIGTLAAVAAAAISQWRFVRELDGHDTSWLDPEPDSPRNVLLAVFVGGTHPVLPWLAFLCVGMLIGRQLPRLGEIRLRLLTLGVALVAATYALNAWGPPTPNSAGGVPDGSARDDALVGHLLSTRPFDRGLLYTVGAIGSAIAAFAIVSWLAERFATSSIVVALRRAGQLTLSLYLAHVFAYLLVVDALGAVTPTGLDTALVLAISVWVLAVAVGAWYQRLLGRGPAERIYRGFGG